MKLAVTLRYLFLLIRFPPRQPVSLAFPPRVLPHLSVLQIKGTSHLYHKELKPSQVTTVIKVSTDFSLITYLLPVTQSKISNCHYLRVVLFLSSFISLLPKGPVICSRSTEHPHSPSPLPRLKIMLSHSFTESIEIAPQLVTSHESNTTYKL